MKNISRLTSIGLIIIFSVFTTNQLFAENPTSILIGFSEKEEAKMKEIEKVLDKTGTIELKNVPLSKVASDIIKTIGRGGLPRQKCF